jgi:hypothetical protein
LTPRSPFLVHLITSGPTTPATRPHAPLPACTPAAIDTLIGVNLQTGGAQQVPCGFWRGVVAKLAFTEEQVRSFPLRTPSWLLAERRRAAPASNHTAPPLGALPHALRLPPGAL